MARSTWSRPACCMPSPGAPSSFEHLITREPSKACRAAENWRCSSRTRQAFLPAWSARPLHDHHIRAQCPRSVIRNSDLRVMSPPIERPVHWSCSIRISGLLNSAESRSCPAGLSGKGPGKTKKEWARCICWVHLQTCRLAAMPPRVIAARLFGEAATIAHSMGQVISAKPRHWQDMALRSRGKGAWQCG